MVRSISMASCSRKEFFQAKDHSMHRRPLAIRAKAWPEKLAKLLSKLGLTANAISMLSLLFGVGTFGFLLAQPLADFRLNYLGAAVFIQGRLICNLLDGLVAVEGGKKTPTGGLYNEVPDRFCDAFTLLGMGYACDFGRSVELAYMATVLAFFTAYIRVLGASLGTASYFNGPQAKQQRMAVCTVALLLTAATTWKLWVWTALVVVTVGSALTCQRRLSAIAGELKSQASKEMTEGGAAS